MSRYSSKCDFCDIVEIWGSDVILNCVIKIGNKKVLDAKTAEDLKPYFGHIIASMGICKEKGSDGKYGVIILCEKSYWEQRKDEIRDIYKDDERMIKERIAQIDEFYSHTADDLYVPRIEVHYTTPDGLEHISCFETTDDADKFIKILNNVKNIFKLNYDEH